jgi:23S rRNA (pseudouridine1915-N3)-methyltransferase
MKIVFHLEFLKPSKKSSQSFKSVASYSLLVDYVERISRYTDCEIASSLEANPKQMTSGDVLWICDRSKGAKILSSEELSVALKKEWDSSRKALRIVIGGPNGFSTEFFSKFKPTLKWCFGTLTLPHELATVVASEQLYRAFTILKNEPYHLGH